MLFYLNPGNFPVHRFPCGMRQAILAQHAKTKAPLETVAASVLAATSTATQHLARVRRPPGPISPTSLALLSLLTSGGRKSSSDDEAFVSIKAFDTSQEELHRHAMERYDLEIIGWKAHRDGIALKIKKSAAKDEPTEGFSAQLMKLQGEKPVCPKMTKLLYADTTPQALASGMHRNSPSAALVSSDASKLLFSAGWSNLTFLSECWSGNAPPVDRITTESFLPSIPALTTSLMIQPGEFDRYIRARGEHIRNSGYLARCLVSRPQSIQGFREIIHGEFIATDEINRFNERIAELLQINGARPIGNIIEFDHAAAYVWTDFFNQTEFHQREGCIYADIADFASKIADNASRIAAIFSHYEGKHELIGLESVQQACEICNWYLAQFKMIFGTQFMISEEQQDASLLEQWAFKLVRATDGFTYVSKSDIMRRGPNRLRNRERLNRALANLEWTGRATLWRYEGKNVVKFGPWL